MTMLQDRYPQITTRTTRTRVAPSMLFSLSGVLMLLLTTLVVVSFSSSSSILPLVVLVSAEEEKDPFVCVPSSYQDRPIHTFEFKKVGSVANTTEDENSNTVDPVSVPPVPPQINIVSIMDNFMGQVYFEADPTMLDASSSGGDTNFLDVELYSLTTTTTTRDEDEEDDTDGETTTATAADCSKSGGSRIDTDKYTYSLVRLGRESYNTQYPPRNTPQDCYPKTTTGEIAAIQFNFEEPFYDAPSDQIIWDPNGGKNDGVLAVCVRVAYKVETELISYFDTKIYLDVNFEAEFDLNFEVEEDVDLQELEEDTNTTTNINLVSFDDDGTMITTMMNDDRNESEYKV